MAPRNRKPGTTPPPPPCGSKRPRHPKKEIEAAVQEAEKAGWVYKKPGKASHLWGKLLPPPGQDLVDVIFVYTTPSRPDNSARAIRKYVKRLKDAGS